MNERLEELKAMPPEEAQRVDVTGMSMEETHVVVTKIVEHYIKTNTPEIAATMVVTLFGVGLEDTRRRVQEIMRARFQKGFFWGVAVCLIIVVIQALLH